MRELLAESLAAGIVQPSSSGWRLTRQAEARYGAALRALDASLVLDVGGSPASRRPSASGLDLEAA